MKLIRNILLLLAIINFGCSQQKEEEKPKLYNDKVYNPSEAIDKAKQVENILQEEASRQRATIDEQTR
ncbi:MAG: hypothetical protein ACXW0Q_03090 [Methylovulum sp.]